MKPVGTNALVLLFILSACGGAQLDKPHQASKTLLTPHQEALVDIKLSDRRAQLEEVFAGIPQETRKMSICDFKVRIADEFLNDEELRNKFLKRSPEQNHEGSIPLSRYPALNFFVASENAFRLHTGFFTHSSDSSDDFEMFYNEFVIKHTERSSHVGDPLKAKTSKLSVKYLNESNWTLNAVCTLNNPGFSAAEETLRVEKKDGRIQPPDQIVSPAAPLFEP